MKILACFKTVPDTDGLPDSVWECGEDLRVDMSFAPPAWNCYEESAMALALNYASKYGAKLHALTIGGTEAFLKTLLALGFESGASIACGTDLLFRPDLVSELVASYIRKIGGCDIMLLGSRSTDGNSGLTGAYLAKRLSAALVSFATGFESAGDGLVRVQSVTDRFDTTIIAQCPCVITVGNSPLSYLPVPTLKDRIRAGKMGVERLLPVDLGVDPDSTMFKPAVRLVGIDKKTSHRESKVISAGTPAETADRLFAALTERLDII